MVLMDLHADDHSKVHDLEENFDRVVKVIVFSAFAARHLRSTCVMSISLGFCSSAIEHVDYDAFVAGVVELGSAARSTLARSKLLVGVTSKTFQEVTLGTYRLRVHAVISGLIKVAQNLEDAVQPV